MAGEPAPFGITPKVMNALADPVRLRILAELQKGHVSPSGFTTLTGVELGYSSRCFRQLCDLGYAEVVEERRAHRGGASVERVYRASERSVFASAGLVPDSLATIARSHPILGDLFAAGSQALEAGTFDGDPESVLVHETRALDPDIWAELLRLLADLERGLGDLQAEARERWLAGDSEPLPALVGATAFVGAHPPFLTTQPPELLIDTRGEDDPDACMSSLSALTVAPEMAKGLSNRWRSRILMELTVQPMSPSQFVERVGGEPSYIARCFRELNEWGLAELAEARRGGRRGGGVERIYRIFRHPHFDDAAWRVLPRPLLKEVAASILLAYMSRAGEAIEAGNFDGPNLRHLGCRRLVLDRVAWRTVRNRLGLIFEGLPCMERESIGRNGGTTDGLVPTQIGLVLLRLPGGVR